jgi:hypothetical protein
VSGEFLPPIVSVLEADVGDFLKGVATAKAAIKSLGDGINIPVNLDVNGGILDQMLRELRDSSASLMGVTTQLGLSDERLAAIQRDTADSSADLMMQTQMLADRFSQADSEAGPLATTMNNIARAANNAGGRFGWLNTTIPLFGGAATIAGWHLLTDVIVELGATILPAAIAFGAFGAVAIPAVQDLYQKFQNLQTVSTATGQNIPPLTGAFSQMADAAKPQVYQILGDALNIVGAKTGEFSKLAAGAGTVLDQLAARFTVAVTNGNGFNGFLRNAVSDLAKWGDVIGNIGGAFGNLFKALPGYGNVLLNLTDGFSKLLEWVTGVSTPLLNFGLALHGLFIYGGLAVTGLLMLQGPLTAIGNWVGTAILNITTFAGALIGAEGAAATFDVIMGALSAVNPLVWVGVAAVAVGGLVYAFSNASSATTNWVNGLQAAANNASSITGSITAVGVAQVAINAQLVTAQQQLNQAVAQAAPAATGAAGRFNYGFSPAVARAADTVSQLTAGQQQFNAEAAQSNSHLTTLAGLYGGSANALGLLNAAGITAQQWQSRSAGTWAQIQAQVAGTVIAYKDAGQAAGVLGADEYVLSSQVNDQFTAMQKLNTAWDAFLNLSLGLEGAEATAMTAMTQLTKDAQAAGASFTGVNANSITLQNDFTTQLYPSLMKVIDSMSQAHAKASDMAAVLSTDLSPAVRAGALANDGMRTAIYDMAIRAGYTGPNQIAALSAWIKANTTSLQNAANMASAYSSALGRIPRNVNTTVTTNFVNVGTPGTGPGGILPTPTGHAAGTSYAPPGYSWIGEKGPELMHMRGGEQILSNSASKEAASAAGAAPGGNVTVQVFLDGEELRASTARATWDDNFRNGNRLTGGRPAGVMRPR